MNASKMYVPKKSIRKLADEFEKVGLVDKAEELRADISKITWEKEAQYQSLLVQAHKKAAGIKKTEWEKKIIEKLGDPNGNATPDCWFTSAEGNAELAKIEMKQGPRDSVGEDVDFGFYTYMGEVCVLTSYGYDSDFDSFSEEFQKKFWELVETGEYEED